MRNDYPGTTAVEASCSARRAILWTTIGYGLMTLGAIGALCLICSYGATLVALSATTTRSFAEAPVNSTGVLLHVLVALTAVIITGLLLAKCCAYLGQPRLA